MVWNEGNHDLIHALRLEIDRRVGPDAAGTLGEFAERFLRNMAADDLRGRDPYTLAGAVTEFWEFIQHFDGRSPKVRVFNNKVRMPGSAAGPPVTNRPKPDWTLDHTVIAVLCSDMPFALESVRGELNRRGLSILIIHSLPFRACRDADHRLKALVPDQSPESAADSESDAEAMLYIEIARIGDPAELRALRLAVEDVLAEVKLVTDDFPAMLARAQQAMADLQHGAANVAERDEAGRFLDWMCGGHFTFLGYEYFDCECPDGGTPVPAGGIKASGSPRRHRNMDLGLLRTRASGDPPDGPGPPHSSGGNRSLVFSKSSLRSRVHRRVYPDYVEVRIYSGDGDTLRQIHRFLGLYTSRAYGMPTSEVPVIRRKVAEVLARSRLDPRSHEGSALAQVLEVFPRDELFLAGIDELFEIAMGINQIQERRQVRLFVRRRRHDGFVSCLVFMPRDLYRTELRQRVQDLLCDSWHALESEFTTYFSESILTRTHFILKLDPAHTRQVDTRQLESRIAELTMSWEDHLRRHLIDEFGEERGALLATAYQDAFPVGYRDDCDPRMAQHDLRKMATLAGNRTMALRLYRQPSDPEDSLRFRLYHMDAPVVLSDVLPILEHLGPIVVGERSYGIHRSDGKTVWIHEFALRYPGASKVEVEALAELFQEAFSRIWRADAESDPFNQLVIGALLSWREVALLRAYARYLKQLGFPFGLDFIAGTLGRQPSIACGLVKLFAARFDPDLGVGEELPTKNTGRAPESDRQDEQALRDGRAALVEQRCRALEVALEGVENLAEDRVLRALLSLVQATVRTNYYRDGGDPGEIPLSFKFCSQAIPELPLPRPVFEIFVYSPRLEGVHLRGGKVARGGLRWSDRLEDFRTEVLGLFKAQQVKNAVIVPTGAKGGFVTRRIAADAERAEREAEGRECYRLFISALLSVTDNIRDQQHIVKPDRVICWDEDDPYLVVAADKGTAKFSDLANEVARNHDFWLGDAFASGGSRGYDHKRMGITARGAWISVQRHFLELDGLELDGPALNSRELDGDERDDGRESGMAGQRPSITVVGIGDMAGDVFGNGMLCSSGIRLLAAFNHQHIFLDPDPDPEASYRERRRLFQLERSTWEDYDPALISDGGGIYRRDQKSISLSSQVRSALHIEAERLRPSELIGALLRAPVDLLWNGGIGTYVKASGESHADVGDKANDALRVNGGELRCRVVGEGGNLGMTQRGRIEYALAGGRCNTDFIDNSAGVDCSDHEVNLKIVLNRAMIEGQLDESGRRELLETLTGEVAQLVLADNQRQTLALSLAERDTAQRLGEYRRLLTRMESEGQLIREQEDLPTDEQLGERRARGEGLVRPELAQLMCMVKSQLKSELVLSPETDPGDARASEEIAGGPDYLARALGQAFPAEIRERFAAALEHHRLRREIIATELANALVDDMGITFVERMRQSTRADTGSIAVAYIAARELFDLPALQAAITDLETAGNRAGIPDEAVVIPSAEIHAMLAVVVRLVRRGTRWLIRNRRAPLQPDVEVERFREPLLQLMEELPQWLSPLPAEDYRQQREALLDKGVPEALAHRVALAVGLYHGLTIIDIASTRQLAPRRVAEAFFLVAAELELDWFARCIAGFRADNYWQGLARETYRDDVEHQLRRLTEAVLERSGESPVAEGMAAWLSEQRPMLERWRGMLADLHAAESPDLSMFAVALRELLEISRRP